MLTVHCVKNKTLHFWSYFLENTDRLSKFLRRHNFQVVIYTFVIEIAIASQLLCWTTLQIRKFKITTELLT